MGLPWSGCTECDHQQEGDGQGEQQDDHVDQQPSDGKTGIPGGERKDAANIVARALMSWVDHTFALLRCQ